MKKDGGFSPQCPVPDSAAWRGEIQAAHGGGGRAMHRLIEKIFIPAFDNPHLRAGLDGAIVDAAGVKIAFSTDSYVVKPLFFPGGDIGSLAVNGTVNDLAMCGARPLHLSAGFILEEGFPLDVLELAAQSMARAARAAKVGVVTGDTKVVEKGRGDGLYINTAGIGIIEHDLEISPGSVRPGDAVILNGDIGRHGIAVMAMREGLKFDPPIESDCAPLADAVSALIRSGIRVRCLRDLTRGGLATALCEIAGGSGLEFRLEESAIPVSDGVRGACEILGLDPLYVANEGRFIAVVPAEEAERALLVLQAESAGAGSAVIGTAGEGGPRVTVRNGMGTSRGADMLSGEQLPRIC
ncbi:MAG: hydrogenase expression/formation protein HypE [Elusimicrobia bacterium RIFCSPHIGHO2_01_FULL_64_10]|nr:MAG: hydrogenase expression/formation protein HypE [Elusimicrobia bacterium RIFCSPHIGHO2_01_FULL_64_10]